MKSLSPDAPQRVGPVAGLAALMAELGSDPDAACRSVGICVDDLDPDNRLPFALIVQLLDRSAQLAGCPHLGLLLGMRYDHRSLGVVGALMSHAPTLSVALDDFVGSQISNSRGAVVYLHRLGTDYALGYGIYDRQLPGASQIYDLGLAIGCNLVRTLTNGRFWPTEVLIGHSPSDDIRPYAEFFKVPIRFNQNQSCVIISGEALTAKVEDADTGERRRILDQVRELMRLELGGWAARVRHRIRPALLEGLPSMPSIADQLGLHPKALARLLSREGTTFRSLLADVRGVTARELLATTDLPIGDIAAALAYANHGAFVHAFRQWTGVSPSTWRQATMAISR
ncbi:AraC-type DNA-binding protein [Kaistia soli DSM 19436]|uniref:AraC-type DNA-binding protein n=1 Tax=Kaistia soli DSM 19436 TaxID=1122133 RepID=A0A1M5L083_9HYPH|nr:AraC family transcriptional regulator [Kaistia soli]SHG58401.1 AraC-type DNA-binding protein [Kaistia soli DSM 19436]